MSDDRYEPGGPQPIREASHHRYPMSWRWLSTSARWFLPGGLPGTRQPICQRLGKGKRTPRLRCLSGRHDTPGDDARFSSRCPSACYGSRPRTMFSRRPSVQRCRCRSCKARSKHPDAPIAEPQARRLESRIDASGQEQPVVVPQVLHFRQVPFRTSVKLPHSSQAAPSYPCCRAISP